MTPDPCFDVFSEETVGLLNRCGRAPGVRGWGMSVFHRARERLVRQARAEGIDLRQSYSRIGKKALIAYQCYAHARQYKRARKQLGTSQNLDPRRLVRQTALCDLQIRGVFCGSRNRFSCQPTEAPRFLEVFQYHDHRNNAETKDHERVAWESSVQRIHLPASYHPVFLILLPIF